MRQWIKIGAAALAFVPFFAFLLVSFVGQTQGRNSSQSDQGLVDIFCEIFYLFVFLIVGSFIKYSVVSNTVGAILTVVLMFLWSSFVAWVFWRMIGVFQGEEEPEFETNPERAKFDWAGFRVRFFLGFVVGFLLGWRFVRYTNSRKVMFTAMTITGLIVGLGYGLYRPNFWGRP